MLRFIKKKLLDYLGQHKWRRLNKHNYTRLIRRYNTNSIVKVGNASYGDLFIHWSNNNANVSIGNYCSIAEDVVFLVSSEHPINCLSTYPYKVKCIKSVPFEALSKGNIIIEDDVWIGYGAIILSGVHIGQGAVVAAGAVVTNDVPPYSVVGGVPARVIKYRFNQSVIDFLNTLDYKNLTNELIEDHIDELYIPLDSLNLNDIKALYSWFPKK